MIFLTNRFTINLNSFHQKTFKLFVLLIITTFLSTNIIAQIFIPDDFYPNDESSPSRLLYSNQGQLLNTDGQSAHNIDYYNMGSSPSMYLSQDAVSVTTKRQSTVEGDPDTVIRVDITPLNGSFGGGMQPISQSSSFVNFYYPHCPQGITQVHGYDRIIYENCFEGIDLHITNNGIAPKLFFVVHPDADANQLEIKFKGHDQLIVNANNEILIQIEQEVIKIPQLIAYQTDAAGHITNPLSMPTMSNLGSGGLKINVPNYDKGEYLILEFAEQVAAPTPPTGTGNLEWSTFYGGNSTDIPYDIDTDGSNNVYVSGGTRSSNFPHTVGYFTNNAGYDGFVAGFDDDTNNKWTTLFGGHGNEERYKLAITSSSIIATSEISSQNGPQYDSGVGYYSPPSFSGNGQDIHIMKLSLIDGIMEHATYFSGTQYNYNIFGDIKFDANNNMIYIVGTGSVPITGNNNSSQGSAFIAKFDENLNYVWGTMLINNNNSFFILHAVEIGINGEIIIGGSLEDPNAIPHQFHSNNIANSYSKSYLGGFSDGFLIMLSPNSNNVLWASHIGGSGLDDITDINVSPANGDIYVSGRTESTDLTTVTNNVLLSDTLKGTRDGFIMRFSPTGKLKYSSYLGTIDGDIRCFTFDYLGNAYFTGVEQSGNAGLGNIQYPSGYYDKSKRNNSQDAFIVMLNTINNPDWITYFGGNGLEVGQAIEISSNHKLYITGQSSTSTSFPFKDPFPNSPANWYDNTASNMGDAFISKFGLTHLVATKNIKITENKNLMVLPNISNTGIFKVRLKKLSEPRSKLYVCNTLGEVVFQHDVYSITSNINLSTLPSGNYYVSLITKSSIETKKIVIIK